MSILNVDKIQPIGGGSTITVDATDIQASTGTITASTFSGDVSATGIGVTSLSVAGVTTFTGHIDASGDVYISDKIIHAGDTDTKIRFPAANTVTVETAGSERLRIESGGDVKINTGDIYFGTAGKGIVLGATSNQDAHTLDHYQEGTTGLTVKCGSVTVPLLNNTCKWTRIGNTLHLSAWIRISGGTSASGISATDPVKITGFPFATVGNSTGRTRLVFTGYSFGNVSNATWGWMVVADGATSTEHSLHWGNPNFSTITAPDGNNITSGGNYLSSEIYLNGHMFV